MKKELDLYKILQVDKDADLEIIKAVYKKLCKKFHPDLNDQIANEDKIKDLNHAYEILSDDVKRKNYDTSLKPFKASKKDENKPKFDQEEAYRCLFEYFSCLKKKLHMSAYQLISDLDKRKNTAVEFANWQKEVTTVCTIVDFSIKFIKWHKNYKILDMNFSDTFEFVVSVVEKEIGVMENKVLEFTKFVVVQNGKKGVYLGYENLKDEVQKIKELKDLDELTHHVFMENKKGLLGILTKEVNRTKRYKRPLSILMLEAECFEEMNKKECEIQKKMEMQLRVTDSFVHFSSKRIVVVLPETYITGARTVREKLVQSIREENGVDCSRIYSSVVSGVQLEAEEMIDVLIAKIIEDRNKVYY